MVAFSSQKSTWEQSSLWAARLKRLVEGMEHSNWNSNLVPSFTVSFEGFPFQLFFIGLFFILENATQTPPTLYSIVQSDCQNQRSTYETASGYNKIPTLGKETQCLPYKIFSGHNLRNFVQIIFSWVFHPSLFGRRIKLEICSIDLTV